MIIAVAKIWIWTHGLRLTSHVANQPGDEDKFWADVENFPKSVHVKFSKILLFFKVGVAFRVEQSGEFVLCENSS